MLVIPNDRGTGAFLDLLIYAWAVSIWTFSGFHQVLFNLCLKFLYVKVEFSMLAKVIV
jgi:hypothetical protein